MENELEESVFEKEIRTKEEPISVRAFELLIPSFLS